MEKQHSDVMLRAKGFSPKGGNSVVGMDAQLLSLVLVNDVTDLYKLLQKIFQ